MSNIKIDNIIKSFISNNIDANENDILLKNKNFSREELKFIAGQISSAKKLLKKYPALATNRNLFLPDNTFISQSSSEKTAIYKSELSEYKISADLTGGFGIDTIHFAKKSKKHYYVEPNPELCRLAVHNFRELGFNNIEIINTTAETFIEKSPVRFDLIYLDPSRQNSGRNVFRIEESLPDLRVTLPPALEKSNTVMIKLAPFADINYIENSIPELSGIYCVASDNELKEILVVIGGKGMCYHATDLSGKTPLEIDIDKVSSFRPELSMPLDYLYEPNPALMKIDTAGIFSKNYNVQKLHEFTHLYTSMNPVNDFPGRKFEILGLTPVSAKSIRKFTPDGKANLSARNFPGKTEILKNKLKIKDGGDFYIFAATLLDNSKKLIICRKYSG